MTKEQTYDSEINPLMAKVIEICRRENIAFVASFALSPSDADELLCCSSVDLRDETDPPDHMLTAGRILRHGPQQSPVPMVNVYGGDGKLKSSTAFI